MPDLIPLPVIRSNPLLVETYRIATNYVISCPPVNSSGDIYHILAYLILCRAKSWYIPKTYLSYDNDITKSQAERGIRLARQLGFDARVHLIQLAQNNGATHSPSREKELSKYMKERGWSAINQKGTTALLACAYKKYGLAHITAILNRGFMTFAQAHLPLPSQNELKNAAALTVANAINPTSTDIILLNHRISAGANDQQSLSPTIIEAIRDKVREQGFELVILLTGGTAPTNPWLGCRTCNAFSPTQAINPTHGKIYHLLLLQAFINSNKLRGIVGATSGTLDIAAFLGIRCFNFHVFCTSQKMLQAQEYRILLQGILMTIVAPWGTSSVIRDLFTTWLRESPIVYRLPNNRHLITGTNHKDRHAFTCFNDECVSECLKQDPYHPYQRMLDNFVKKFFKHGQPVDPIINLGNLFGSIQIG